MSKRFLITAVILGGLTLGLAETGRAFDLTAPIKAWQKLIGKKPEASPTPVLPPLHPSSHAAAPDSATVADEGLDEILLTPEPYQYEVGGRPDPFASLIGDDDTAQRGEGDLGSDEIFVRGILWGENDRFALVETARGDNVLVREGDSLGPYTVTRINPDAVWLYTTVFGVGRTLQLPLMERKEVKNGRGQG